MSTNIKRTFLCYIVFVLTVIHSVGSVFSFWNCILELKFLRTKICNFCQGVRELNYTLFQKVKLKLNWDRIYFQNWSYIYWWYRYAVCVWQLSTVHACADSSNTSRIATLPNRSWETEDWRRFGLALKVLLSSFLKNSYCRIEFHLFYVTRFWDWTVIWWLGVEQRCSVVKFCDVLNAFWLIKWSLEVCGWNCYRLSNIQRKSQDKTWRQTRRYVTLSVLTVLDYICYGLCRNVVEILLFLRMKQASWQAQMFNVCWTGGKVSMYIHLSFSSWCMLFLFWQYHTIFRLHRMWCLSVAWLKSAAHAVCVGAVFAKLLWPLVVYKHWSGAVAVKHWFETFFMSLCVFFMQRCASWIWTSYTGIALVQLLSVLTCLCQF